MKKNVADIYSKGEDRFERGITHNLMIVNQCLKHISYELTSEGSEQAGKEQQHDEGNYSQSSKKKASSRLIEESLRLSSKIESNRQAVSDNGPPTHTREAEPEDDKERDEDMLAEHSITAHKVFRTSLVNLMILSLKCWEQSTWKTKIDLAEESKLWRVNVDNGQLRVRTLDRYLDVSKLPRVPRVNKVFHTVYFVLDKSKLDLPVRGKLEKDWAAHWKCCVINHDLI